METQIRMIRNLIYDHRNGQLINCEKSLVFSIWQAFGYKLSPYFSIFLWKKGIFLKFFWKFLNKSFMGSFYFLSGNFFSDLMFKDTQNFQETLYPKKTSNTITWSLFNKISFSSNNFYKYLSKIPLISRNRF